MTTRRTMREVIGGVDTHRHTHHAAAIDAASGKLLGDREFAATAAGYRRLLGWLASFGMVIRVGVEGTGSYGAGLVRHLSGQTVAVVEVARPNRQARRFQGKSDRICPIVAWRALTALRRVMRISRIASTAPSRGFGMVVAVSASTARAALIASMGPPACSISSASAPKPPDKS